MTSEKFWMGSKKAIAQCKDRIDELGINGALKVTISDTSTRSAQQLSLQWKWYTEVAESGVGGKHEDDKNGVHVVSKFRFARPIIKRDDPDQWEFIQTLENAYSGNSEAQLYIAEHYIHTKDFKVKQMAEYLSEFQRFYGHKLGVNLTIPGDILLKYK